jgi:hypothetical protein
VAARWPPAAAAAMAVMNSRHVGIAGPDPIVGSALKGMTCTGFRPISGV